MKVIHLNEIIIENRQRKEKSPAAISHLKSSILSKGLLHPVVLAQTGHLLAGETRILAVKALAEEGYTIMCDDQPVPINYIPYNFVADLSKADLAEAELEENLLRTPLTWQEQCEAKVLIHELREASNPGQTITQTAREIAAITEQNPITVRSEIQRAKMIVAHKDNPKVQKARSEQEAYKAILDDTEAMFKRDLTLATQGAVSNHTLIKGDCIKELPKLPANKFSLILCDPPYGIDVDTMGKKVKHFYDDSAENALNICKTIIREGFRVTQNQALMFMFCSIEHFLVLRTYAAQQAWSPWKTPLIWCKGPEGSAPWGRGGFKKTYECILFLSKGGQELRLPGGADILTYARVARSEKVHGAEKPQELLERLLQLGALPGENVLDPCAGSGSIIPPANKLQMNVTAIEFDDINYAHCLTRLENPNATLEMNDAELDKLLD